jgi:hypothetical protein
MLFTRIAGRRLRFITISRKWFIMFPQPRPVTLAPLNTVIENSVVISFRSRVVGRKSDFIRGVWSNTLHFAIKATFKGKSRSECCNQGVLGGRSSDVQYYVRFFKFFSGLAPRTHVNLRAYEIALDKIIISIFMRFRPVNGRSGWTLDPKQTLYQVQTTEKRNSCI